MPTTSGWLNSRKLLASVFPPAANQPSTSLPDPKDKIQEQNLLHRALIATQDNRFADAHRALDQVLQLNPKSSLALRQLGEIELQTGDYQQATAHSEASARKLLLTIRQ